MIDCDVKKYFTSSKLYEPHYEKLDGWWKKSTAVRVNVSKWTIALICADVIEQFDFYQSGECFSEC